LSRLFFFVLFERLLNGLNVLIQRPRVLGGRENNGTITHLRGRNQMRTHAQTRVCTIAGVNILFVLVMLVGHQRYYHPAQLLGEYDGGGKMSKGLGVQAHDLGWDGGEDYKSSRVTYSHLPVVSEPSVSVDRWFPDWKQLTSAQAYSNLPVVSEPSAYSNTVPAYSNLPVVSEPSVSVDKWFPDWKQLTSAHSNSVQDYRRSVSAEMGSGGR